MSNSAVARPWLLPILLTLVAVTRALTVESVGAAPPLSDDLARQAWADFASREPAWRESAAEQFPTDPWSQDDDFFASERGHATSWANEHGVSRQSVFFAIDRGMREKWPLPSGVTQPRARVAPCRPRALE